MSYANLRSVSKVSRKDKILNDEKPLQTRLNQYHQNKPDKNEPNKETNTYQDKTTSHLRLVTSNADIC